jgi:hypothetical protein
MVVMGEGTSGCWLMHFLCSAVNATRSLALTQRIGQRSLGLPLKHRSRAVEHD